jgi:hypothetical protein
MARRVAVVNFLLTTCSQPAENRLRSSPERLNSAPLLSERSTAMITWAAGFLTSGRGAFPAATDVEDGLTEPAIYCGGDIVFVDRV